MKTSVILTTFNVETYIATAIQSVLDANLPDMEIILVDDGSSDQTRVIINQLNGLIARQAQFVPIFFSQNTKGGVASAANAGLDVARGDTIVFVDGDDWVIPHNLAQAVERLDAGTADFLVTDCSEYWNNSGAYTKYPEAEQWARIQSEPDLDARKNILLKMAPMPWRKIYRRDFLSRNNIRFPVGDFFFEDNPFHWETTTRAESFDCLRLETHIHRMNREGQTIAQKGEKFLKIYDHFDIILAGLHQQNQFGLREVELAAWLLKHIIWSSDKVPPAWLNDVYDMARPRLEKISDEALRKALHASAFQPRDIRRLTAIRYAQRMEFLREF